MLTVNGKEITQNDLIMLNKEKISWMDFYWWMKTQARYHLVPQYDRGDYVYHRDHGKTEFCVTDITIMIDEKTVIWYTITDDIQTIEECTENELIGFENYVSREDIA